MTWLNQAVSFGWMLLVLPLVLREWSTLEVSLWLALSLLVSLGLLADLGFRPTVARSVAYALAGASLSGGSLVEGDPALPSGANDQSEKLGKLVGTIHRIYSVLTLVGLFLCVVPGIFVVWNIIHLNGDQWSDWATYAATILQVVVALNMGRFGGILEGLDLVAATNRLHAITGLLRLAGTVALILAGYGVLAVAVLGIVILLVQAWVLWIWSERALNKKFACEISLRRKFDRTLFDSLWAPAWRSGVISVGGYLISQGTTVVAAQLKDPKMIASYLLTMRVLGFAAQLVRVPLYARLPVLNGLRARGEIAKFKEFFAQRLFLVIVLSIAFVLAISVCGDVFFRLLAPGREGLLTGLPLWVLSAWLILEAHHGAHAQAYMTTNHVPFMVPALVSGALIVGISYALAPWGGVLALVWVLFGVQLAFNNWYPVVLNLRSLRWPFKHYLKAVLISGSKMVKAN